jgi:serine/threonine-protein kinase
MENAARPASEADWAHVEAFVRTAAADENITEMIVADSRGVIRASANASLAGEKYTQPYGQKILDPTRNTSLGNIQTVGGEAFRFVTPILYSGRTVGTVQVGVRKNELQAAAGWTRTLLIGLGVLTMAVTIGLGFFAGRVVLSPLRRLNAALREAGERKFDFRISHKRRDEFGELFDSFNALAETLEHSAPARIAEPDISAADGSKVQIADTNTQVAMLRAAAAAMGADEASDDLNATRLHVPALAQKG